MKKFLLFSTFVAVLLCVPVVSFALSCSGGTAACGSACNNACSTARGITYAGMCIAGNGPTGCTGTAVYVRCSTSTPICASGQFGALACKSDSDCTSGQVCVSDSGNPGCGTGFAQCMTTCTDTTTTTTTTTTSTSTTTTT